MGKTMRNVPHWFKTRVTMFCNVSDEALKSRAIRRCEKGADGAFLGTIIDEAVGPGGKKFLKRKSRRNNRQLGKQVVVDLLANDVNKFDLLNEIEEEVLEHEAELAAYSDYDDTDYNDYDDTDYGDNDYDDNDDYGESNYIDDYEYDDFDPYRFSPRPYVTDPNADPDEEIHQFEEDMKKRTRDDSGKTLGEVLEELVARQKQAFQQDQLNQQLLRY